MLSPANLRAPLVSVAITSCCILIFLSGFLLSQSPPRPPRSLHHGQTLDTSANVPKAKSAPTISTIDDAIRFLFSSMKYSPTDPEFISENGTALKLPKDPLYKEELGRQVLILDLETRDLTSDADWKKDKFDWRTLDHIPGGIFNHYAYAAIHGYDYKLIKAAHFTDRRDTWIKPSAFANVIKDYKFVVFLDSDAVMHHMHLPIEWLLNFWQIKPIHSITMALDPWTAEEPQFNSDERNRTLGNTGFMIIQNNSKTPEILKAWHECPDDTRYKGCSKWKQPTFHEQSAFGNYIRYDYPEYVRELPCSDGNGFPEVEVSNCKGEFVRHFWFDKDRVKADFAENMMQALTKPIQRAFSLNVGGIVKQQKENRIL